MAELLLELFSEEIPARMQRAMADELLARFSAELKKRDLFHTKVETYVTPRRLVLFADGFSLTQENKMEERRGPRVDSPQQAIDGFLRSTGLSLDQLTKKETPKGIFYFAIIEQKVNSTKEEISNILRELLPSLVWPKSMRWGNYSTRWVRPLKNICCLFGAEIMPLAFGHVEANNLSYGHRFLAPGSFEVGSFEQYKSDLEKRYVILSSEKRQEIISEQAEKLAQAENLTIEEDEALVKEVSGLVEWPYVLMGDIESNLMNIPEEALISSVRTHQKYFTLRKEGGSLAPKFLVVSNMKSDSEGAIISGNERVLRARLSDAHFFFEQDKKKPLAERTDSLKRMIFHARLGTVEEKTKRIKAIAKFIAVWVPRADLDLVDEASKLCKADLATEMVGEFPELQGCMGYYYAKAEGLPEEVSEAIRAHYSPLGPNDTCPDEPVSIAVAIADKVDTLSGLFAIGGKPTGSKDPYALRRSALGVIRIILENNLSVPLRLLFSHAIKQHPKSLFKHHEEVDGEKKKTNILGKLKRNKPALKENDVIELLLNFFADRLKSMLKADNVRHDLINAVFDEGREDDLLRLVRRVAALESFLSTDSGDNLLAAYRRATNIVRIEEKKSKAVYAGNVSKALLEQAEEKNLWEKIQTIRPQIKKSLKGGNFEDAMGFLAELRAPVDAFFEEVTVNCKAKDVRKNRLFLLSQMRELLHDIANFEHIESHESSDTANNVKIR